MALLSVALQQEFDRELDRLALSAERNGMVEGVFRLRALLDICEALPTTSLLALASLATDSEKATAIVP